MTRMPSSRRTCCASGEVRKAWSLLRTRQPPPSRPVLNGRPRLLDVIQGRSGNALSGWVSARNPTWRDGIGVAALDPFRGYATALRTTLPGARRVLDAFHVTRLGFDALDQVRRLVQQDTLGHRGHVDDPLFGIRRVLRRGAEHHSQRSCARLLAGLEAGDHDQQVALAGSPPRTCARIYRCRDRAQAERHLLAWFTAVAETRDPRAGPTGPTHRRLAR